MPHSAYVTPPRAWSGRRQAVPRCMFCWHSKGNHTRAGRVGPCTLSGCNCPAFKAEVEP